VLDRVKPPPVSTTGRSVGPYSGKSNAARSRLDFFDRYKRPRSRSRQGPDADFTGAGITGFYQQ
jgi:hypothetical protein